MSSSLSGEEASQIRLLSAQYFQLVPPDDLSLPSKESIIRPNVQAAIYENMFNEASIWPIPSVRYRTRVLKRIITTLEESISNPDEDVWLHYLLYRIEHFLPYTICLICSNLWGVPVLTFLVSFNFSRRSRTIS